MLESAGVASPFQRQELTPTYPYGKNANDKAKVAYSDAHLTRSDGEFEDNSQNDSSRGMKALKQIVRQTPALELE
jgi:hypothetical protein